MTLKKLPNNFKPLLEKINNYLKVDNDMTYGQINFAYNRINKDLEENQFQPYDLNRVLNEYEESDDVKEVVGKLRKLTKLKNKHILKDSYRSKSWVRCIKRIKHESKSVFPIKIHTKDIETGLIKIMKNYYNDWLGYWGIMKLNGKGEIKKIKLYNKDDHDSLFCHLADSTNWQFNDSGYKKSLETFKKEVKKEAKETKKEKEQKKN